MRLAGATSRYASLRIAAISSQSTSSASGRSRNTPSQFSNLPRADVGGLKNRSGSPPPALPACWPEPDTTPRRGRHLGDRHGSNTAVAGPERKKQTAPWLMRSLTSGNASAISRTWLYSSSPTATPNHPLHACTNPREELAHRQFCALTAADPRTRMMAKSCVLCRAGRPAPTCTGRQPRRRPEAPRSAGSSSARRPHADRLART